MDFELFLSALKETHKLKIEDDKLDVYLEKQGFKLDEISNPKTIYDMIILVLKEWIDMDERYYWIVASWIIGTYFIDEFSTYPYLFINAVKRSGKTRLLKLCAELSNNGVYTANLTEAVLFRLPAERQISMFIDEAENISSREKSNLRLLLNSAYKRGMKIYRTRASKKTGKYLIDEFELFFPLAICNIYGIDDVLEDRCITLILERSNKKNLTSKIELFKRDYKIKFIKKKLEEIKNNSIIYYDKVNSVGSATLNTILNNIIEQCTTLDTSSTTDTTDTTDTNGVYGTEIYKKMLFSNLVGRDFELWLPILCINFWIEPTLTDTNISIAKKMMDEKRDMEIMDDRDTSILLFLANYIKNRDENDFIPLSKLSKEYRENEGIDKFSSETLSRTLKRLKIMIEKRRLARGREVRIDFKKIEEKIKNLGLNIDELRSKYEQSEEQKKLDETFGT